MKLKFREFNQNDWDSYAGIEGGEPCIAEGSMVEYILADDPDNEHQTRLGIHWTSFTGVANRQKAVHISAERSFPDTESAVAAAIRIEACLVYPAEEMFKLMGFTVTHN